MNPTPDFQPVSEPLHRWRLLLGGGEADGTDCALGSGESQLDAALDALYEYERRGKFEYKNPDDPTPRQGGSGGSNPSVARWLGDVRRFFPDSVVQVMQQDALRQPALKQKLLLDPEILEQTAPDVHLVATLLELGKLLPDETRETARHVVRRVVDELLEKLSSHTVRALSGALNRQTRSHRPRPNETDWPATIRKNLKHYQPEYRTLVPETLVGYGRKTRRALREVVLCLDQSGSMGSSVVYSGIFGAVMASIPALKTRLVAFDTEVADLTEDLQDPVDLLFGVQLGGGTDIARALTYCQGLITQPEETILVLISDLYEGGNVATMHARLEELVRAGVQVIGLLALSDDGAPAYEANQARFLAGLGVPVFACTPDRFPALMAAAIARQDLAQWAGEAGMVLKGR